MKEMSEKKRPEDLRVVEEKIPMETFSEFFSLLEDEGAAAALGSDPKARYISLAKEGSVEAFRKIEESIGSDNLSAELRDFALVALNYCRFRMENDFFDIPMDMVSGGLGGVEGKLRIYVAVAGKEDIKAEQFESARRAFESAARERDSILEEAEFHGFYISFIMLLSINYAFGELIEDGIGRCDFLKSEYYATNVEIPTDDRIRDWLDGKLDDESA